MAGDTGSVNSHAAPLTDWVSVPTVLVTGPTFIFTFTQISPFLPIAVAITYASTHYAYPQRDG